MESRESAIEMRLGVRRHQSDPQARGTLRHGGRTNSLRKHTAIEEPLGKPHTSIGFTNQKILTHVTNAALAPGGITLDDMEGVRVANIISNVNAFKEGRTDWFVFALGSAPIREADAAVDGVRALMIDKATPEATAATAKA